jgi:RNA polymerase sigma factor (sigma-70 family)
MDLTRLPNRELVRHLVRAAPDDPLWREFVSRFGSRIRLVVLRSFETEQARSPALDAGSARDAVDDLTQDVFVRLLEGDRRALGRFRGQTDHSIYTYLNAIAVNLVRDHFKKLRALKMPRGTTSLSSPVLSEQQDIARGYGQSLISDGPGPERFVAAHELREAIASVISESSRDGATTRDRLIFRLYFIEGLTVDEIAKNRTIGLSLSGVEKCIRRMREALKSHFSSESREVEAPKSRL